MPGLFRQFTLYLASGEDPGPVVVWQSLLWCSVLCLLPAWLATPPRATHPVGALPPEAAWLALGGLCSLGNQWFRTLAYQGAARVSTLAPLLYFGVVVALALETLWSGRLPSGTQLLGTACIVLAAIGAGRRAAAPRPVPTTLRSPQG